MSDFHNPDVEFSTNRVWNFYNSDVGFLQAGCRILNKSDVGFSQPGCRIFTTRMSDFYNFVVRFSTARTPTTFRGTKITNIRGQKNRHVYDKFETNGQPYPV